MISIKLEHVELIPKRFYYGKLDLDLGTLTKICGDNGVGKSSFYHYCRINEKKLFPSPVCFLEQKSLAALNNYTIAEIEKLLMNFWSPFLVKNWPSLWSKMLKDFHLKYSDSVDQLSGGQNQLLKLLISSLLERDIYFWDEPFSSLDPKMIEWWIDWIKNQLHLKKTLIMIDHSQRLDSFAHKIFSLEFKDFTKVEFTQVEKINV